MSVKNYQLVVQTGPEPGRVYPLQAAKITIGRDPMSDIAIGDPEVSRTHARLEQTGTGYQIQDLGSTNGTFINGQRMGSEVIQLLPGQEIVLGSSVALIYEEIGADEAAMATIIDAAHGPTLAEVPAAPPDPTGSPPPLPDLEETPVPTAPEPASEPQFTPPPSPPPPPAPPSAQATNAGGRRRRTIIIGVVIALLLCCCCAFLIFMYQVGGDFLLEALQSSGTIP